MKQSVKNFVAKNIAFLKQQVGLSSEQLADKTGMSPDELKALENFSEDQKASPLKNWKPLIPLANYFMLPLDAFCLGDIEAGISQTDEEKQFTTETIEALGATLEAGSEVTDAKNVETVRLLFRRYLTSRLLDLTMQDIEGIENGTLEKIGLNVKILKLQVNAYRGLRGFEIAEQVVKTNSGILRMYAQAARHYKTVVNS